MESQTTELLHKIKALADRGTGGGYYFAHGDMPGGIDTEHSVPREWELEKEIMTVFYSGSELRFIPSANSGILCLDERYLARLSNVLDMLVFYERVMQNGQPYIAAKAGFFLEALIQPFDAIGPELIGTLARLHDKCSTALSIKNDLARIAGGDAMQRTQQLIFSPTGAVTPQEIDPETGEITDAENK